MSQLDTYQFGGKYTLRPATEEDLPLAAGWTDLDVHHREVVTGDFWISELPGVNCYLLEDPEGPVFFFRLQLTADRLQVQIYMQFAPLSLVKAPRLMDAIAAGMRWLEGELRTAGYRMFFFKSRNPQLIAFCRRRLGFIQNGERLERALWT